MSKGIGFRLNEKTAVEEQLVAQGVYNGFGKIHVLPSIIERRREPVGFSPKELGELFIEMGIKLKNISHNITDIKTEFVLIENVTDMGKQLSFVMTYKEIENE